jgi:hypothetical protein
MEDASNTIRIEIQQQVFVFPLHTTFLEVRRRIAEDLFQKPNGYVELYNNTSRIYKDYGKLFFDYGLIPSTFDYYPLSDITIGGRTFIFHALPSEDQYTIKRDGPSPSTLTGLYQDRFKSKKQRTEEAPAEFVYYENDFPSLS